MFFQDFIYAKEDALAPEICDEICNDALPIIQSLTETQGYNDMNSPRNKGWDVGHVQFEEAAFGRNDFQIFMPPYLVQHRASIKECLDRSLIEYASEITSVQTQRLYTGVYKFQLTNPKGGFHKWHIDQAHGGAASRSLVWMIYLNDIPDGSGDTEFLYQGVQVKPEKGKMVMWPAGITHPHRGNPPYGSSKMILTGWFSCPSMDSDFYFSESLEKMGRPSE